MPAPWQLIFPRSEWRVRSERGLRIFYLTVLGLLFIVCALFSVFAVIATLGELGIGPIPSPPHRREFWSVFLGTLVVFGLSWLLWRSLRRHWRNLREPWVVSEGVIAKIEEDNDDTEGGIGKFLRVRVGADEHILHYKLQKYLRPGMHLRVVKPASKDEIIGVWMRP